MTTFSVWAPRATTGVDLLLDGNRSAMERGDDGWWSLVAELARPGSRYGFSIDGGPLRADPRSASQPDGPEGLSQLVDHEGYAWGDRGWRGLPLPGAVLYEVHVGTFSAQGTFDGVIGHLPHLVELGVDAIELMPPVEFPGERGWGYDGVNLFAPHHAYGGPEGLRRLVDACHRAGVGVVVDAVYNHFGPSGNYLPEFGPYLSDRHHTNWGQALNFDGPGSDEVRRFVIDNALTWLRDYHADGLRLDATHAIVDLSPIHILEELAGAVRALAAREGRNLFVIAESDLNDPRLVRSPDAGGYGLDAVWADDWHHAVHAVLTGERSGYYRDFGPIATLAKALRQGWVYDGQRSGYRGHTQGREAPRFGGDRLVISTQNHDQVGNRAAGERTSALLKPSLLKVAAALLLFGPFTPLLFQGEEWGASSPFQYFTDHQDPDLARAVSEGRTREFEAFGWRPEAVPDPQDPATFDESVLRWGEIAEAEHTSILEWHRLLLGLRTARSELRDPRLETVGVDFDEERRLITVERGRMALLVNLGGRPAPFPGQSGTVLASSTPDLPAGAPFDPTAGRVPAEAAVIIERPGH